MLAFTMQKGNNQTSKLWLKGDNSAIFWEIGGKKKETLIQIKNNSTWHTSKPNQIRLLSGVMWIADDGAKSEDTALRKNTVTQL